MKLFKVGDKVQSWFPTNQRGPDGHSKIDLAAGVVVEIDGDSINNPYLVRFDNLDGTYIDHWLAASDLELRNWDTKDEENRTQLHNPKTHTIVHAMAYEVDGNITIETFRVGNEQRMYARSFRYYTMPRDVERLLCILNGNDYNREIKRGNVTGCLFVTCRKIDHG